MVISATPHAAQGASAAGGGPRSPFARLAELIAPYEPGKTLIAMSLGEPQHPIPAFVGPVLARHVNDFGRYPIAKGIEPFRAAASAWLTRRFALPRAVDPDTEVLVLNAGVPEEAQERRVPGAHRRFEDGARLPVVLERRVVILLLIVNGLFVLLPFALDLRRGLTDPSLT